MSAAAAPINCRRMSRLRAEKEGKDEGPSTTIFGKIYREHVAWIRRGEGDDIRPLGALFTAQPIPCGNKRRGSTNYSPASTSICMPAHCCCSFG